MFDDDDKDDLDAKPEEIEDLDAPDQEGEDVVGGAKPVILTKGCTCSQDCLTQ